MHHDHKHHQHLDKSTEVKTRAIHRIKIIKGHLKKVQAMLEEDAYCVDVVHQSKAIQSALKKLDILLIEDHLNNCVIEQIQNGEETETTAELLKLFEYK